MPSDLFEERWRSRQHTGAAKPAVGVQLQPGLLDRKYDTWEFLDGTTEDIGVIEGGHNAAPWQAYWRATGAWKDVPNILTVDFDQSFENNGIETCTITLENVIFKEIMGAVGMYHAMMRGYLSPAFGYKPPGRPDLFITPNDWFDVLNSSYRIRIWQGYGPDTFGDPFIGQVDEVDITSDPGRITLTARDFGCVLTDERVHGWNKARELRSPITFADRLKADNIQKIAVSPRASSSQDGYPPANVAKQDPSYWLSEGHPDSNVTEWVQVRLKAGRYESFYLYPEFAGMEAFVAVFAHNEGLDGDATIDGEPVSGWIDLNSGDTVPGDNGGFEYMKRYPNLKDEGNHHPFGHKLVLGDGSILRIAFRNLIKYHIGDPVTGGAIAGGDGWAGDRKYHAAVRRLVGIKRTIKQEAKKRHWILVDDAADVVKWVFRWAGFHQWEVESMGARLDEPLVFDQTSFLIDIVNKIKAQGDYVFFMSRSDGTFEDEIGVPVFRSSHAIKPAGSARLLRFHESELLTHADNKFTKEPLAFRVVVRGATPKKGGVYYGEEKVRRYQGTYFPPWSGANPAHDKGRANIAWKYLVYTDTNLKSNEACAQMAILIGIQMALVAETMEVAVPAYPVRLDEQVSVMDAKTGTNTRMWVAQRSQHMEIGNATTWTMNVGGARIDTPDLAALLRDYAVATRKVTRF